MKFAFGLFDPPARRPALSTIRCSRSRTATCLVCTRCPGSAGDRFDEHRAGLDHVSFGCADRAELEGWKTQMDEPCRNPQ